MNSLILCEGSTDAILLSYYLNKTAGWQYCRKAPDHLHIKPSELNQSVSWYQRDQDRLLICGVGGKDNMSSFFKEKIARPIINADAFSKLVLILDRDSSTIEAIQKNASQLFSPIVTRMKNDEWIENTYINAFQIQNNISCLLLTVPQKQQGALETLILKSIAEDPYDAEIVRKAGIFVKEMRQTASRYLSNDRMLLKAHLGVTWAVQYPQKTFSLIDEQIRSVPWEKSAVLRNCFRQLENL